MSDISALYAEKLAKLIRIPTVTNSDRQNFVAFRKTLAEEFPAVYRECEVIRPGGGRSFPRCTASAKSSAPAARTATR